jgi:hypothetical protein
MRMLNSSSVNKHNCKPAEHSKKPPDVVAQPGKMTMRPTKEFAPARSAMVHDRLNDQTFEWKPATVQARYEKYAQIRSTSSVGAIRSTGVSLACHSVPTAHVLALQNVQPWADWPRRHPPARTEVRARRCSRRWPGRRGKGTHRY